MDATGVEEAKPSPMEFGVFGGGFISNYFHQFYDVSLFPGCAPVPPCGAGADQLPNREELKRVSPLLGLRFAYFVKPWFGVEGTLEGYLRLPYTLAPPVLREAVARIAEARDGGPAGVSRPPETLVPMV